jgi:hypothetical protein
MDENHVTHVPADKAAVDSERQQMFDNLMADAVAEPNAVRANVQAAAADLFEIAYLLAIATKNALRHATRDDDRESLTAALPAVSGLAQLHRQAARYMQLDGELAGSQNCGHPKPR